MFPVAILAGGLGKRLGALTQAAPKSLVRIHGRPFIEHQLQLLRSRGVEHVVICAGYRGEMIRDFVGNGSRFGLRIDFSFDGPALLGTARAIEKTLPLLGDAFFVLYGDSYLPCDYRAVEEVFRTTGKRALMTVLRNEDRWDASNVELAQDKIVAYDKQNRTARMRHIDYGLGVFDRSAFTGEVPTDLASLYQDLLRQNELAAFVVRERFYEIGSVEGLRELNQFLAMDFTNRYLGEAEQIIPLLDRAAIEKLVNLLAETRTRGGRLFILGVGGSAANASHAVNDFRKLAGMEAYSPTDNVSELTARINDEGWPSVFESWLQGSRLRAEDLVLVFSVGGGDPDQQVSPNLVSALRYAKSVGAKVGGIVGRDGGFTAQVAEACVVVPTVNHERVTPHTEAFQAVIWHLLVSHPALKTAETKWESMP